MKGTKECEQMFLSTFVNGHLIIFPNVRLNCVCRCLQTAKEGPVNCRDETMHQVGNHCQL